MINIEIRKFNAGDFEAVKEIYRQGIETANATFETSVPVFDDWLKKFVNGSLWVALCDSTISGWCGLSRVSQREAYWGVCEVSVYVDENFRGAGIGKQLLMKLIEFSESNNIWTLQASIFPENKESIRLHLKCGFRVAGRRERIGKLHGKWRDTILLERRSLEVN